MRDALLLCLLAAVTATLVRSAGGATRRLERLCLPPSRTARRPRAPSFVRRRAGTTGAVVDRREIADLVERLAALTRAGVAPGRAWHVLATSSSPTAGVARTTSDMVASGGSTADGLRLAVGAWAPANGPPGARDAVGWLALATDVVDRSGAPSAAVYDGMAAGILAELARLDEQDVAFAGARTTASLLTALPLVGAGLGYVMGANVLAVLLSTPIGRLCLVAGVLSWLLGRRWTRHLVSTATRPP